MSYEKLLDAANALSDKLSSVEQKIFNMDDVKSYIALETFSIYKPDEELPAGIELIYAYKARLICAVSQVTDVGPMEVLANRVKALGGNALLNVRTELGYLVGVPALLAKRGDSQTTRKQLRDKFRQTEVMTIDELQPLIDETNRTSAAHNEELMDAYRKGFRKGVFYGSF